jgi:hypothetical protein
MLLLGNDRSTMALALRLAVKGIVGLGLLAMVLAPIATSSPEEPADRDPPPQYIVYARRMATRSRGRAKNQGSEQSWCQRGLIPAGPGGKDTP